MKINKKEFFKIKKYCFLLLLCLGLLIFFGCGQSAEGDQAENSAYKVVPLEVPTGVSVLMYHMIAEIEDNPGVLSEANFRAQMKFLKDNNYNPITLDQLNAYVAEGAPLPLRPVCITFDDGYADNYEIVYPVMKEYGFPWAIFVIGADTGSPGRVTWDQLRQMKADGVTVANHTWSHREMPWLPLVEQREELKKTQIIMERELGITSKYFCYPYGLYSDELKDLLRENGFVLALTMDPGRVKPGDDPLEISRIWIGNAVDIEHFEERLTTDSYRSL